jgi:hypothetical protein
VTTPTWADLVRAARTHGYALGDPPEAEDELHEFVVALGRAARARRQPEEWAGIAIDPGEYVRRIVEGAIQVEWEGPC